MNRDRLSFIAHSALELMSPVPATRIDRLLHLAALSEGDAAVDIGAGKGGVAVLALKRGANVTLVERSPLFAELAREAVSRAGLTGSARIVAEDASTFVERARPHRHRLAINVGASHALGGRDAALSTLASLVTPQGHVLFGEGYWRRPPSPEYLAALGATEDELGTRGDIVAAARARGLALVAEEVADEPSFEAYELGWCAGLERFADEHPDDPDAAGYRAVAASRRDAYHRWGREQLGFAVHLFARGPDPSTVYN